MAFFPYLTDDSSWGNFKLGYVYNAAYQLHRGARDITFLGVEATNLVYFLSNPNWANKTKSVKFATPKSVAMINDGRAPKLSYITPWLGNTKFGFSYTPDNAHRRGMVSRYTDYEKRWMAMFGRCKTNGSFPLLYCIPPPAMVFSTEPIKKPR